MAFKKYSVSQLEVVDSDHLPEWVKDAETQESDSDEMSEVESSNLLEDNKE